MVEIPTATSSPTNRSTRVDWFALSASQNSLLLVEIPTADPTFEREMSVAHVAGLLRLFSFRVRSLGQTTPTCGDRSTLLLIQENLCEQRFS